MLEFDLLTAEQIEVRVAQINEKSCSLLLYKDARVDMNMLDRHPLIGPENWQCKYYECKGNLYCSVGILAKHTLEPTLRGEVIGEPIHVTPKNSQWIWKDDCGTESYTEKQKGEASDAFKRACFRWGIGRELYTSPDIMFWCKHGQNINLRANNMKYEDYVQSKKNDDSRPKCSTYDKFSVEKIKYNDQRQITDLAIRNNTLNKRVFVYTTTGKDD